jgi:S1-C subfamily serine protease
MKKNFQTFTAKHMLWILTVLGMFFLSGCGTQSNTQQLQTAIDNYKKTAAPQKAMAVGYAPNGHWVAGWVYSQTSITDASEKALNKCNEQSLTYGGVHRCRVVYLNNDFHTDTSSSDASTTPPNQKPQESLTSKSTGSGVFVSRSGLILTADHVVRGAKKIEVITRDGQTISARVESSSKSLDIAFLKVAYESKVYFPIKSSVPTPGARVFTVGFPVPGVLGQEPKVSEGIISSVSGIKDDASFMQISIPIQPGNSGGPVITEKGELVGVVSSTAAVSAFLKRTGTLPQNVNWAARASMALGMVRLEQKSRLPTSREESLKDALSAVVMVVAYE